MEAGPKCHMLTRFQLGCCVLGLLPNRPVVDYSLMCQHHIDADHLPDDIRGWSNMAATIIEGRQDEKSIDDLVDEHKMVQVTKNSDSRFEMGQLWGKLNCSVPSAVAR